MSEPRLNMSDIDARMRRQPPGDEQFQKYIAFQDVAARNRLGDGDAAVFMVFTPTIGTVALSRSQEPSILEQDALERWDVEVTRRNSAGGASYYGEADITFAFGLSQNVLRDQAAELSDVAHMLFEPIKDAFSQMGIDAHPPEIRHEKYGEGFEVCNLRQTHPFFDIHAGDEKIAAAVFHNFFDDVVYIEGAMNYSLQAEREVGLFDIDANPEELEGWMTTIEERTDLERQEAASIFEDTLREWSGAGVVDWSEEELAQADHVAEHKYMTDKWVQAGVDPNPLDEYEAKTD